VLTHLQAHEGALSFATDAWTSPNHKAFVAVTVHFEINGHPNCLLLDIVEVAKSHSGVNLAVAFARILDDFGICDKVSKQQHKESRIIVLTRLAKILSVTCDNASCNDTMVDELADLLPSFPGKANQTRCFLHIINLVAKSIIRQFDVAKGKAGEALDEAEEALCALAKGIDLEDLEMQSDQNENENDDNVDGWVDERNALSATDRDALDASVRPVKLMLVKVISSIFVNKDRTHLISTAPQDLVLDHTFHDNSVAYMVPDA